MSSSPEKRQYSIQDWFWLGKSSALVDRLLFEIEKDRYSAERTAALKKMKLLDNADESPSNQAHFARLALDALDKGVLEKEVFTDRDFVEASDKLFIARAKFYDIKELIDKAPIVECAHTCNDCLSNHV